MIQATQQLSSPDVASIVSAKAAEVVPKGPLTQRPMRLRRMTPRSGVSARIAQSLAKQVVSPAELERVVRGTLDYRELYKTVCDRLRLERAAFDAMLEQIVVCAIDDRLQRPGIDLQAEARMRASAQARAVEKPALAIDSFRVIDDAHEQLREVAMLVALACERTSVYMFQRLEMFKEAGYVGSFTSHNHDCSVMDYSYFRVVFQDEITESIETANSFTLDALTWKSAKETVIDTQGFAQIHKHSLVDCQLLALDDPQISFPSRLKPLVQSLSPTMTSVAQVAMGTLYHQEVISTALPSSSRTEKSVRELSFDLQRARRGALQGAKIVGTAAVALGGIALAGTAIFVVGGAVTAVVAGTVVSTAIVADPAIIVANEYVICGWIDA